MKSMEAECVQKVKGLGDVYRCSAPADAQLAAFEKVGISRFVLPSEVVAMRMAGLTDFTRTCVAPVVIKGENPILIKYSPFMNRNLMSLAVAKHRKNQYPDFFPAEFYEAVKQEAKAQEGEGLEPQDRDSFMLQSAGDFKVESGSETAQYLGITPEYFTRFHAGNPIDFFNLPNDVPKGQSRVNYLWFVSPVSGSDLVARVQDLGYGGRTFGVRGNARSADAKNLYTATSIRDAVAQSIPPVAQTLGISIAEKGLVERLPKAVLLQLRQ